MNAERRPRGAASMEAGQPESIVNRADVEVRKGSPGRSTSQPVVGRKLVDADTPAVTGVDASVSDVSEGRDADALAEVRLLIEAGVPVFVARPNPRYDPVSEAQRAARMEFLLPRAWQSSRADDSCLDRWRPGWAICLVAGSGFDVVDVDTKNGADVDEQLLSMQASGVQVLGRADTPSGGAHLFVMSTGICSSSRPRMGVDFRGRGLDGSGSGFVYLSGTQRPRYSGRGYTWICPPDVGRLDGLDRDEQRDAIATYLIGIGVTVRTGALGRAPIRVPEGDQVTPTRGLLAMVTDLGPSWKRADGTDSDDRSERFYQLVGECQRVGLTLPQAAQLLDSWCLGTGKFVGRVEAEVGRCWPKVMTSSVVGVVPGENILGSGVVISESYSVGQSLVAEWLVERGFGRFLYVPGMGWLTWDDRRWDHGNGTAELRLEQAVIETARQMIRQAADEPNQGERGMLLRLGHSVLAQSAQVGGVVACVRRHPKVLLRADDLNTDPLSVNVLNGTLDLRTQTLRPHDPRDHITRVAGTTFVSNEVGGRWPLFLGEALGNPDLVAAVLRCYGGVGLPGLVREHVLPIIWGPSGSGKSTFLETISAAMGDYAITAEPELMLAGRSASTHPTGQMDLLGIRLAFVAETDEGRRFASATMKRLTGGDRIRARRMFQNFMEFRPSHLLCLVTNHLPVMPAGDDPAVWRRVKVIPFDRLPAKPDKRLGEVLKDELPAVLASLVAGFADYTSSGDDLGWPVQVQDATANYRTASDLLGQFLDARTEAVPGRVIPVGALYLEWKIWLEVNAPDVRPGRTGDFVQKLRERGETVTASASKDTRSQVTGRRLRDVEYWEDGWDLSDGSGRSDGMAPSEVALASDVIETSEMPQTLLAKILNRRIPGAPS